MSENDKETEASKYAQKLVFVGHSGIDLNIGADDVKNPQAQKMEGDMLLMAPWMAVKEGEDTFVAKLYSGKQDKQANVFLDGSKVDLESFKAFNDGKGAYEYLAGVFQDEISSGAVQVTAGDLDGLVEELADQGKVVSAKAEGGLGQGASNAAYQAGIFNAELKRKGQGLDIGVMVCEHGDFAKHEFGRVACRYHPLSEGETLLVNINQEGGVLSAKLNLRSSTGESDIDLKRADELVRSMSKGDVLAINSLKNQALSEEILEVIKSLRGNAGGGPSLYMEITDSMIRELDRDVIMGLMAESEVYSARADELDKLLNGAEGRLKVMGENPVAVLKGMQQARGLMRQTDRGPRVYLTDDDRGSYALTERGRLYKAYVAKNDGPVRSGGAGDAFFGTVCILEQLRDNQNAGYRGMPTKQILQWASSAGQINARYVLDGAVGPQMGTPSRIKEYIDSNPETMLVGRWEGFVPERAWTQPK